MDVVVTKTPDGWTADHDQVAVGKAAALMRPDARCFVVFGACHSVAYEPLVQAIAQHFGRDLYTEIGEADTATRERLLAVGFVVNRREHTFTVPTDPAVRARQDRHVASEQLRHRHQRVAGQRGSLVSLLMVRPTGLAPIGARVRLTVGGVAAGPRLGGWPQQRAADRAVPRARAAAAGV